MMAPFETGNPSVCFTARGARSCDRKLRVLKVAQSLTDLDVPAGNRLERLCGERGDQYSIRSTTGMSLHS